MLLALILTAAAADWKPIVAGVEYRTFAFGEGAELHAVRIDPEKAELAFGLRSQAGGEPRTAKDWSTEKGLAVAINAGMFKPDYTSNVGKLVDGAHVNQAAGNAYKSMLVWGPKKKGLPRAQLLDLDAPGAADTAAQYAAQVQNLRLIKGPGTSLWKKNDRAWSEAAIAQDADGKLLFLFSRAGLEMADWNARLLALPLKVTRAMHVEGGPEASLSIHGGGVNLDLCGSYETGFNPNDFVKTQSAIPNVVGVRSDERVR